MSEGPVTSGPGGVSSSIGVSIGLSSSGQITSETTNSPEGLAAFNAGRFGIQNDARVDETGIVNVLTRNQTVDPVTVRITQPRGDEELEVTYTAPPFTQTFIQIDPRTGEVRGTVGLTDVPTTPDIPIPPSAIPTPLAPRSPSIDIPEDPEDPNGLVSGLADGPGGIGAGTDGPGSDGNTSDGTGPGNTGGVGDGPAW